MPARLMRFLLPLLLVSACTESIVGPVAPFKVQRSVNSDSDQSCSFARGTTTCTSTSQYQETETRVVYGGCVAGPTGVPGRSVTTYEDTYLVTVVTTTEYHGVSDQVADSSITTTRQLVSSVQISRTCEPI